MRWELAIIERFTVGLMIGFSYYPKEDEKDFTELNFFLIFFALHFKFY